MHTRTAALVAAVALAVVALGVVPGGGDEPADRYEADRTSAADAGLTLGPIPDEMTLEAAPDLIPVGSGDEVWGYAYTAEVFADRADPDAVVTGYDVYAADGTTLLGHVDPGRGFAAGGASSAISGPIVTD